MPGLDVRIFDSDTLEEVPQGADGEVCSSVIEQLLNAASDNKFLRSAHLDPVSWLAITTIPRPQRRFSS
jgi:hypothetical protein